MGEKKGTGQTVGWIAARGWKPTAKVVVVGGNHLHHRKQFVSNQPRTHVDADALVNSMCTQCAAGGKPKLDLIRSHSKLSLVSSCKKFIYFYYTTSCAFIILPITGETHLLVLALLGSISITSTSSFE